MGTLLENIQRFNTSPLTDRAGRWGRCWKIYGASTLPPSRIEQEGGEATGKYTALQHFPPLPPSRIEQEGGDAAGKYTALRHFPLTDRAGRWGGCWKIYGASALPSSRIEHEGGEAAGKYTALQYFPPHG